MRPAELKALYTASYPRLVVQLYGVLGDLAEAQDCVQDAFVAVLAHPRVLDDVANPEAYLRTAAINRSRSRFRRRSLHDRLLRTGRLSSPAQVPELGPDRVALIRALQALPTAQREAIALHHLGDLSVTEVAATTGAPVGTVKARLSRGRARLAELLADDASRPEKEGHHA